MRNSTLLTLLCLAACLLGGCSAVEEAPPEAEAEEDNEAWEPMVGSLPGDLIPAFTATVRRPPDLTAPGEVFDSRATKTTTVYIVNSSVCPTCQDYAAMMVELEATYMPRQVDVVHLYPNRNESAEENIAWHTERGFLGGQILDAGAAIARQLDVDTTPTVFIVGADGLILYRGAIDDTLMGVAELTPFVANALEEHLAGHPVSVSSTEPLG